MKKLFLRTMLLLCALVGSITSGWAAVVSGTTYNTQSVSSLPVGWSGSDGGGTSYLKLIESNYYIQTSDFAQNGFTSIKIKARKFGGPSAAQALITVSWYTNNTETVLGTIAPSNTTLSDYTISSPTNPAANTTGYVKIQCKGASSAKGSGISQVTINYTAPVSSVATPTFSPVAGTYTSAQNVTLSCTTTGATIYYTLDGTTPTASSDVYSSAINVSDTKTINAIAIKGTDASNVASATFTILPVLHAGTETDPYTISDARNALTAGIINSETDYYVRGYITKKNDVSGGSLTYFLTDDLNLTTNLKCYNGKYIGGADFTDATDFEVGDIATVKGKLQIYQSNSYQFAANNEVVSVESRTKVNIATFTATTTDLAIGGTTNTTVTNDQAGWTPAAYTYASDDETVATVNENGVITGVAKGTANITVTPVVAALDPTYKVGDSKSIEVTVHKPSHTATFSVNGVDTNVNFEEDDAIVFPTNPVVLGGRTFVGWTEDAIAGTTNTTPTFVTSATMGTADVIYYAVFAGTTKVDGWQKLNPSEISEGGVYALITPNGRAFNGNISSGHGQSSSTAFTFVNGVAATAPTSVCEITLTAVEGGYTMYNADHGYLYASDNTSGSLAWHDSESSYWEFASDNWKYAAANAFLRSYNNTFRTYSKNTNDEISFAKKTKVTTYSDYCTTITDESITITTTVGLGTLVSDLDLDFTNVAGLEAYIAKENGDKIELKRINKVPAGTGILLRSTDTGADYTVPLATSTDDVTGNLFVRGTGAAVATTDATYTNYILSTKSGVVGFYHANNNIVAVNRAYLHTSVSAARIDLSFDELTGINEVKNQKEAVEDIFDLQGRKVAQPAKGLYIVNGKKVVIK